MPTLLDRIRDHVRGDTLDRISTAIGADRDATRDAVDAALPLLVGALARNATASDGAAASLSQALDQDHDGTLLDHLDDFLGAVPGRSAQGGLGALVDMAGAVLGGGLGARSVDGGGILSHVLGNRLRAVDEGIARLTGLDRQQVRGLLELLAPIVMNVLGTVKKEEDLDAAALADRLDAERQSIESEAPGLESGTLFDVLDADDDASMIDDVARIGKALGGLFGK